MDIEQFKKHIEVQIKSGQFKNKEDLYKYLMSLKNRNINYVFSEEDIKEILKIYDSLQVQTEIPLEMTRYTNKTLEDRNYIVSEQVDRVLTTNGNSNDFVKEFKDTQNEIMAYSQNGSANAQEVFNKLANNKKEEANLITLSDAIARENIDSELLHKIRFFVTRSMVNPAAFRVDIEKGVFFNGETNELYEVRKQEETNQYEIISSGEVRYDNTNNTQNDSETLINDSDEEIEYSESLEKKNVKVRKLVPPKNNPNNAAFTKMGLLILNIISFAIIGVSLYVLLSNK